MGTAALVTMHNNGKVNENLEWVLHTHQVLRVQPAIPVRPYRHGDRAKGIPADGQGGVLIPLSNGKSIGKAKTGKQFNGKIEE